MRCLSCDKRLNARESTRKYASSGTFVDLCDRCFSFVSEDIPDTETGVEGDPHFDETTDDPGVESLGVPYYGIEKDNE